MNNNRRFRLPLSVCFLAALLTGCSSHTPEPKPSYQNAPIENINHA
ncbi:type IV secretion system protein VirB7 [Aliivibrio fischeri]|nr:type IV secretion system protein VirB7 [Aliivibrio fischeri]MUK76571.1 type IV secretion system protein VirB7 [Aliivibrio fischeri]